MADNRSFEQPAEGKKIEFSATDPPAEKKIEFKEDDPPVVVVGGGPAGLLIALGAAEKGHNVLLITKYPYAVRGQMVKLDKETIEELKKYRVKGDAKDDKFFNKLMKSKGPSGATLAVDTIERFLLRKLKEKIKENEKKVIMLDRTEAELSVSPNQTKHYLKKRMMQF